MLKPPAPAPVYRDVGFISGLALITLLTAYNLHNDYNYTYQLIGGYAVVPLASAVLIEKLSRLLVIGVLTFAAAIVSIEVGLGLPYDFPQQIRLALIVFSTAFGMWAATRRLQQSRQLFTLGEVARSAQRAIMRPDPPDYPGLTVDVRYLSAATAASVGGDAYEAVATDYGLRVLVADARGKGLDAVRSAATVLGSFREWARQEKHLSDVLRRLNCSVEQDLSPGDFVTALVAQVAGSTLTFATAGHPTPIRFRGGSVQALEITPSPPLGLFTTAEEPMTGEVTLAGDDVVLLYSDGLSEARNAAGQFFPVGQVMSDCLSRRKGTDLSPCIDDLLTELRTFVDSRLQDDMVLVAVQLKQTPQDDHVTTSSRGAVVSAEQQSSSL